jgi:hypothetical protein
MFPASIYRNFLLLWQELDCRGVSIESISEGWQHVWVTDGRQEIRNIICTVTENKSFPQQKQWQEGWKWKFKFRIIKLGEILTAAVLQSMSRYKSYLGEFLLGEIKEKFFILQMTFKPGVWLKWYNTFQDVPSL